MFPLSTFKFRKGKQVIIDLILKPLVEAYEVMKGRDCDAVNYDENAITKRLVWYLKHETSIAKLYQKRTIAIEMRPKEQATIEETYEPDIKILVWKMLWMEIEAKRFYEKNNWSISEYLSDDGIGRFLSGRYSKNEKHGGMIGYIQNGNFHTIIQKIKAGLLRRDCKECHDVVEIGECLLSIHNRISSNDIEMYHLFFYFS